MEEQKNKFKGLRKASIGITAITALTLKSDIDFNIAVIIGIIAIAGIMSQGILDWKKGIKNDSI